MRWQMMMAGFGVLAVVTGAWGADFTIVPEVTAAYALNGDPVTLPNIGQAVSEPLVYQVDFSFTISNLGANEGGFGGLAADINLGPGLTAIGGWRADQTLVANVVGATRPMWDENADVGQNRSDLKAIVAVFSLPPYDGRSVGGGPDPRVGIGELSPAYFGSLLVEWDGVTKSELALGGPTGQIQYRTFNPATNLFNIPAPYVTDANAIEFGSSSGVVHRSLAAAPEAGTLGVVAAGALMMLRRRRR